MAETIKFPVRNQAWRVRAACRDMDTSIFYPEGSGAYKQARKVCRTCLVVAECLAMAQEAEGSVDWQSREGMFGGLTPRQRAKIADPRECDVCGGDVVGRHGNAKTCSDRCHAIAEARYHSNWNLMNRTSPDVGYMAHGRDGRVNAGCSCSPCKNRRRARRREARLRAELREVVA